MGLMDADIYGPSQPKMLGLNNSKVEIKNKKISPKKIGNLSMMSMGMLFPEHEAIIWRGPMLMKGYNNCFLMLHDNQDYFIVDLPWNWGCTYNSGTKGISIWSDYSIDSPRYFFDRCKKGNCAL